jgi:hypothetical protein
MTPVRAAAEFLFNLLMAAYATNVVTGPLWRYSHLIGPSGLSWFVLKTYAFGALAAFGLGYSVYRAWRQSAAEWVWVAGLCWFGQRAILVWFEHHAMLFGSRQSVLGQMSGIGCISYQSCSDMWNYSTPFVRTVFYSAGAICCARVAGRELPIWRSLYRWRPPNRAAMPAPGGDEKLD